MYRLHFNCRLLFSNQYGYSYDLELTSYNCIRASDESRKMGNAFQISPPEAPFTNMIYL